MDLLTELWQDAHPMLVHFPLALLVVSGGLSWLALKWKDLNEVSWHTLWLGVLSAGPAVVTGQISHEPYEATKLAGVIQTHQLLAFVASGVFGLIMLWRGYMKYVKKRDVGHSKFYLLAISVAVVVLLLVGRTGGQLVFEHGINVRVDWNSS